MTDSGAVTIRKLSSEGESTLYELNVAASDARTGCDVIIPSTGKGTPILVSSTVKIVSANNITSGTCLGTIKCAYTKATKTILLTEAGKTTDVYRIEIQVVQ